MVRDTLTDRRDVLRLLAGGAALVAGSRKGHASEAHIAKLIEDARTHGGISQRIDFISAALRGTRYLGYTLIGGPRQPEVFVARDDGFDCVTYCETVLAAAIARNIDEFETILREIRYHKGIVTWRERNHYFFEWSEHNVENKLCKPIVIKGSVKIEKTVYWHKELGKRHFAMTVIPHTVFLANKSQLMDGDIVGFVTHRPDLDYFHVGFVIFSPQGELLLRHAAKSRHGVLDERMDRFITVNRVGYVTLLRPQEPLAT